MVTEIIGPIIGIAVGPKIGTVTEMVIGITIAQITEGKTVVKGMVIETRTTADPGIEIEIGGIGVAPEKAPNPEAVVDPKIDTKTEDRVEMMQEIGDRSESRSRSSSHVSTNRDRSQVLLGAMNMTILQENALMMQPGRNSE